MQKKHRTLLAVLTPLILGTLTALAFLANYLNRKSAVLIIQNRTGTDILGGGIRIASEPKEEEVGPIANGDSTVFLFRNVGEGAYLLSGKLKNGSEYRVTGGQVIGGKDTKDRLVLEMQGDSVTGTITHAD
ncbi:MAG: hypothetical protein JWP91_703 [Fibrobacteres bacterium]|nr:hypothetical protein [Fibrobacterota bacterium]